MRKKGETLAVLNLALAQRDEEAQVKVVSRTVPEAQMLVGWYCDRPEGVGQHSEKSSNSQYKQ